MISLVLLIYKLTCKETTKTKFRVRNMHGVELTRAEINASNYSAVWRSLLFERTPKNILELVFQHGYCIFSTYNPPKLFLKFRPAGPGICYLFIVSCQLSVHASGNRLLIEQIRQLTLLTVEDTKQNNL